MVSLQSQKRVSGQVTVGTGVTGIIKSSTLQVGSQVYSNAASNEDSGCKSCCGQGMGKIGENFGVEPDKCQM